GRPRGRPREAAAAAGHRDRRRARRAGRGLARGPLPRHDHPPGGPILMFDPRLIRAEILKLRTRPGLLTAVAVCTFVAVAGYYAVIIALHAASPDSHAAAGGLGSVQGAIGGPRHVGPGARGVGGP